MGISKNIKFFKRVIAMGLATTMLSGTAFTVLGVEIKKEDKFKTQVGGQFDGIPLFNGNPDDIEEYLDVYLDYIGLEGAAVYATDSRNTGYTLTDDLNPNKGKTIPGAPRAQDNVQGVKTDFPTLNGMALSWNTELLSDIGSVWGNERLNTVDYSADNMGQFNAVGFTAVSDIRINPLTGRFDESLSEDPYLTDVLLGKMTGTATGVTDEDNEDGFWTKAILGTKHYSNYGAQWFRRSGSFESSARGLYEYQAKALMTGVSQGSIMGAMTSYGRTNGVPNIMSPSIEFMRDYAPYGWYTSPDAMAYNEMTMENAYSNGFDTQYAPYEEAALALYQIANSTAGGRSFGDDTSTPMKLVNAVRSGLYGVTEEDVYETARHQITQLVRVGFFNERDDEGYPINYPYLELSSGFTEFDENTEAHKEISLRAAEESIVLLKNDKDLLPLDKDNKVVVFGEYADARFKTTYSSRVTPGGEGFEESALSPLGGIRMIAGEEQVTYATANQIVAIQTANGKYLQASTDKDGDVIYAEADDCLDPSTWFEVYDWGQDNGYSYRSIANDKWIDVSRQGEIQNNGEQTLNTTENPWDNGLNVGESTMPTIFRQIDNGDGTISLVYNSYGGSFGGGFEYALYGGQYLTLDKDDKLDLVDEKLTNKTTASKMLSKNEKFTLETVVSVDEIIENTIQDEEYAIVVVGAPTRHSAGEGADRSELAMSDEQYELVESVAAKFPGKTVVVLKSSFPVEMGRIQDNKDVAAILYQPYGGQYDGYTMGQMIYGDIAPTGRLTSTWYADMSALPKIDEYSIPEGDNAKRDLYEDIDPRFTVDYTNTDPIETGLTYMYTDADVTYEFGYGLSYSDFKYNRMNIGDVKDEAFTVSVDVTNKGDVDTSEVVQVYISNKDSAYGDAAPKKQLVGFEKVYIPAGETKTVSIDVNINDFALWDVNRSEFIVESGMYTVSVGKSSEDIQLKKNIKIDGEAIAVLDATKEPISVFDHAFVTSNVTYREASRENTIEQLKSDVLDGGYYAVMSKESGAWVGLNQVDLTGVEKLQVSVATTTPSAIDIEIPASIEIRLDSPKGDKIAEIEVNPTSPITYTLEGGIEVTELGYQEITVDLEKEIEGIHDLYIVFNDKDIRINTLQCIVMDEKDEVTIITDLTSYTTTSSAITFEASAIINGEPAGVDVTVNGETVIGNNDRFTVDLEEATNVIELSVTDLTQTYTVVYSPEDNIEITTDLTSHTTSEDTVRLSASAIKNSQPIGRGVTVGSSWFSCNDVSKT